MKIIAILLLASLPVPQVPSGIVQNAQPAPHFVQQARIKTRHHGTWYFARTGHAVYCYGPVMTMKNADGGLDRVATVCKGDQVVVPLKD